MAGTDLYERTITYDYGDNDRQELMRKVWSGTPWMVDAYTGSIETDRDREMRQWCRDQFGNECLPIHGRPGRWQRGGATIYGWTWFGFDTEDAMNEFIKAWPAPEGVSAAA